MSRSESDFDSIDSSATTVVEVYEFKLPTCSSGLNILHVLVEKSYLKLRRQWPWVLGIYLGIVSLFLIFCATLRIIYPFKFPNGTNKNVDLEIGGDWVLTGSHTDGVIFIGYAPKFPLIEALMEEVERILFRNGLPVGIREFQTVPFKSEYSMDHFIRSNPGVLQYAFAFSIPDTSYPKLSPVLDIISYIHNKDSCYIENYPPCPGEVYIAKVIMEAFVNAHSEKENNVTLSYRAVEEDARRRDPIFQPNVVDVVNTVYSCMLAVVTWTVVFVLAAERERVELTLRRMGISLGLNYAANMVILIPTVIFLVISNGISMSTPYFGNVPIIYWSDPYFMIIVGSLYATSLVSYCVLGSVLFQKAANCVMVTCLIFVVSFYADSYWDPPPIVQTIKKILITAGTQRGVFAVMTMERT
ncbi:hypothetical protein ElyMa_007034100, partial [Elysia marginata]